MDAVTIAIPFLNAELTLEHAIESVLMQSFRDFRLLLVNDGSTDRSVDIARQHLDDERVSIVDDGRRFGLSARLNQIADLTETPLLARMDADDAMHPDRIAKQVRFLREHPAVDVVGTDIYVIDASYRVQALRKVSVAKFGKRHSYLQLFHPTIVGRTAWFRDNRYSSEFPRCEDADLWMRVGGGNNIQNIAEPLLFYNRFAPKDVGKILDSLRDYRRLLARHRTKIGTWAYVVKSSAALGKQIGYQTAGKIPGAWNMLVGDTASEEVAAAQKCLDRICTHRQTDVEHSAADPEPSVILRRTSHRYPESREFGPDRTYPELSGVAPDRGDNPFHEDVREIFRTAGLDTNRFGTPQWNPLGKWITRGMTVLVKPNWVKHESADLEGTHVLFTDPFVLRAVIDYVLLATGRQGKVIVADSPLQGADFSRLKVQAGIENLSGHYSRAGLPVVLQDLRVVAAEIDDNSSFIRSTKRLDGDPLGYSIVDLGSDSRLEEVTGEDSKFEVSDYRRDATRAHHRKGVHEYCVANSVLNADVIINVPKLKSHLKAGMTGAMKNFVGVNCDKAYLPHYRTGPPRKGGDEYPDHKTISSAISIVKSAIQHHVPMWAWKAARFAALVLVSLTEDDGACAYHSGGWHGNDTLWRTIYDICDIVRNRGVGGARLKTPRPVLTLVDAVIAGEGPGPLRPVPRPLSLLCWGEDVGAIDLVCAGLMGFDHKRIPTTSHLRDRASRRISDATGSAAIRWAGNPVAWNEAPFTPPPTWRGQIEASAKRNGLRGGLVTDGLVADRTA